MRAVTIHEFAGPEALQVEDVQKPEPGAREVLIEVYASSLNPVDRKSISRDSEYKTAMHLPVTPGWDLAGVVEQVGDEVVNIRPGDRVFGQASVLRKGTGAFAEYAVTMADAVAAMPETSALRRQPPFRWRVRARTKPLPIWIYNRGSACSSTAHREASARLPCSWRSTAARM